MDANNLTQKENEEFKERLLQIIRERSYREGSFTLASGAHSTFYLDVKETALNPEGAFLIGALAVSIIDKHSLWPHAVGGLTLGADPLATAVSLAAFANGKNVAAFLVRKQAKDHGTLAWIEGAKTFPKGAELVVLEDVATTGGSALKAVDRLVEAGFKPTAVLTVVDRMEGAQAAVEARGLKFFSLCNLQEIQRKNRG
jgi:orotate phosphoribosyltransferase